jgi:hypothetical protein
MEDLSAFSAPHWSCWFMPAAFHEGSTKRLPDWSKVHEELKRRSVTHRAGRGYYRYVAPGFMLRVGRRARDAALSAGPRGT